MGLCQTCADKACYGYSEHIRECEDFRAETNYDRLISKTPEELAEWISTQIIDRNIGVPVEAWLEWLKQEATE